MSARVPVAPRGGQESGMQDNATSRLEPLMDPGPLTLAETAPREPDPVVSPAATLAPDPVTSPRSSVADQLARLEDKTSRIEEKLARSEAATQRVVDRFETASHRMSEVAQQTDLIAARGDLKFIARRTRSLPGFPAVILASAISAILTSALTIAIIRFLPAILGR